MTETIALAEALMACQSVTPARGMVFGVLERALTARGFIVERFVAGEAPDGPVENLIATRGQDDGVHFGFAGHLDVVPPGAGWRGDPFIPVKRGEFLYGRGAVDMKGAIAAFVTAAGQVRQSKGRLSLFITGDEEGPATYGTAAIMEWVRARRMTPDFCLVGEPTSNDRLGDMMKIGRRGSVNIWVTVSGVQGHVAYPHLADNPIGALVRILARVEALTLDKGTEWFQPSNIEITSIDVGNPATNLIPAQATARISIRFNDRHSGAELIERIRAIALAETAKVEVTARITGEAFLSRPGPLSQWVEAAVIEVTGLTPESSTTGGTSDARFFAPHCPVVEFGLPNATMHKVDEAVALSDLEALTQVYAGVLSRAFAPGAVPPATEPVAEARRAPARRRVKSALVGAK